MPSSDATASAVAITIPAPCPRSSQASGMPSRSETVPPDLDAPLGGGQARLQASDPPTSPFVLGRQGIPLSGTALGLRRGPSGRACDTAGAGPRAGCCPAPRAAAARPLGRAPMRPAFASATMRSCSSARNAATHRALRDLGVRHTRRMAQRRSPVPVAGAFTGALSPPSLWSAIAGGRASHPFLAERATPLTAILAPGEHRAGSSLETSTKRSHDGGVQLSGRSVEACCSPATGSARGTADPCKWQLPPSPLRRAAVRAQDPHHRGIGPQFGRRALRLPRVGL